VKVAHDRCEDCKFDYVIFPIGYKYNEALQSLHRGDEIQFLDGSKCVVESVVRLQIKSAIAESLCNARYGFGIKRALEIWKDRAMVQKVDPRAISENMCLIVFYNKKSV
jgi:hypothetical protein